MFWSWASAVAPCSTPCGTHVRPDQVILDLVSIPDGKSLRGQYVGLCW